MSIETKLFRFKTIFPYDYLSIDKMSRIQASGLYY